MQTITPPINLIHPLGASGLTILRAAQRKAADSAKTCLHKGDMRGARLYLDNVAWYSRLLVVRQVALTEADILEAMGDI